MNRFIGTWKLVSVEDRLPSGEVEHPYGEHPAGLLVYDSAGHISVQIMRENRPPLSSDNLAAANPEEIKAAADGFTAFFGTYTFDETQRTVTHRVEGHLSPNSVGKNLVRRYEFIGERLVLSPTSSRTIVWEKASARS